jgi:heptosyltransferase-2
MPTKQHPAKILIIGPAWVGDMVMAQSLFIALKQQSPDCLIDVLAPDWSMPLLERMPEVNQAIAMPLGHGKFGLKIRINLARQLAAQGYRQAFVLPNSWKSALIPFFAGIAIRTGFIGEGRLGLLNDIRKLEKTRLPMTVQRFVALAANQSDPPQFSYPRLQVDSHAQAEAVEKFALNRLTKILALCAGAEFGPAKRWPVEHFAEVARQKHQQGWQVWLFGSEKDRAITEQIDFASGGICTNLAGRTSLGEAIDLLALASVVVSNDSGLMHVAAALDRKLIALYGSSDPGFTPPLHRHAGILSLQLDCAPCFQRQCPLGHTRCLTEILPERVLAAINAAQ